MSENLTIWNTLGRTDPDHTKGFSRAGGFRGTAVKPVYTEQKMTETFGPCGIGWGFSEPQFQLVPGSDGQTAVYCWLSLWYVHGGARSAPIPGVGGDMVIVKQSSGLRTDDEAFKKAFTDAIGNAMKHIGMSADVHMGRFDDSKYVQELRDEARQESNSAPQQGRSAPAAVPRTSGTGATLSVTDRMIAAVGVLDNAADIFKWWNLPAVQEAFNALSEAGQTAVEAAKKRRLEEIEGPFQEAAE
jgi:hypothetical protein